MSTYLYLTKNETMVRYSDSTINVLAMNKTRKLEKNFLIEQNNKI